MTQNDPGNDYPLSEVPMHARKSFASTAMVFLGFTFFTATMFAGGKLGVAFSFGEMMAVIVVGNLLLVCWRSNSSSCKPRLPVRRATICRLPRWMSKV